MNGDKTDSPRKLRWPWFVLVGVVTFLALSAFWLSREVNRIKRYKAAWSAQTNAPSPQTSAPPAAGKTN